ncbi:rod shape-determining protein RodA [Anaerococcus sp. NML200537]|uniref:rod shape-determining protein RodA n=1 Tax=Anaerococcus sp. NML200537 TaxID=2954485 RepID=UPI0022378612|nr:rod shape-determining protein RodA [Anaerococcus sp. NML200537]MCW6701629.1 rod shape-determining protein RodA [Anaerococcus sp. NML200537]
MFNLKKKNFKDFDIILLLVTICLSVYGLVVLYSAYGGNLSAIKTQIFATILGFLIIGALCTIDLDVIKKPYMIMYAGMIIMLISTLFLGRGLDEWGARSWIYIGSFSFQPAEIAKVILIFCLAAFLDKYKYSINSIKTLVLTILFAGFPIFLILLQPDFGTSMVYLFFIAAMIFIVGISWKWIGILLAIGLVVGIILLTNLSGFRADRIENFLNPNRDTSGSNWQQQQGMIAIGSGMIGGRGYLNGSQSQYGYIPEKETDFIFSVLAEELGFVGAIIMLVLFTILILRLVLIAKTSNNTFISLLVTGIAGLIFIHVFENIGMTIGLMPVTGIPLPFFSNGGTFQLIILSCVGLALSSSMQKTQYDDGIVDNNRVSPLEVTMVRPSKRK